MIATQPVEVPVTGRFATQPVEAPSPRTATQPVDASSASKFCHQLMCTLSRLVPVMEMAVQWIGPSPVLEL